MNPKTHTQSPLGKEAESLVQKSKLNLKLPPPEKMERKAGGQGKAYHEIDFAGKVFGLLTPIKRADVKSKYGTIWIFQCSCGNVVEKVAHRVFKGLTKSCGCYHPPRDISKHGIHGSTIYRIWCGIINRCCNSKNKRWPDYGGRGIALSPLWRNDPLAFANYLGPRPSPSHSVDRIDVNGDYEPGNVRWADRKTQQRNMRSNVVIKFNGESKCLSEWAEIIGIKQSCLAARIRRGWSLERAMSNLSYKYNPQFPCQQ